jgi:citrate synthase
VQFAQPCALSPRQLAHLRSCAKDPFTRLQIALSVSAAVDVAAHDLRPAAVRQAGARIVQVLTKAIARHQHRQEPIHRALQAAWAPQADAAGEVIRTALVLCADHELTRC